MNAVSLARQSQKNDEQDDSVSLAFQFRVAGEEAKRRGDEIVREFSDLDVPGDRDSSRKRTGLADMIAFLRVNPTVRRVYVYNVSRLARDAFYVLELVRQMRALTPPVELRSASESIEDPTILTIVAAFSERERITLSNNVAHSIREQASRGLVTQQPPYGYSRHQGILIPNQHADTVRSIFRDYLAGRSTYQIAEQLQRDGIRSPYGKPAWTNKAIRRLLARRTYIGEIEISETRDPAGRVRPHVVAQGLHEPLIDPATWAAAQELLSAGTWVRKQDGRINPWLAGAAFCASCGRRLYFGVKSRRGDQVVRWYAKCATHQLASDNRTEATCAGQASCDLGLIEPAARRALWDRLSTLVPAADAHQLATATLTTTSAQTRRQLEARLARHQDRSAALLEARMNREITPEEFMSKRAEETALIDQIEQELQELPMARSIGDYRAAHAIVQDAALVVPTAPDDVLRRIVASIKGSAFIDLRSKQVTWSFGGAFADLLG